MLSTHFTTELGSSSRMMHSTATLLKAKLSFYVGDGDLNSGSQVCRAGVLTHWLFSTAQVYQILQPLRHLFIYKEIKIQEYRTDGMV